MYQCEMPGPSFSTTRGRLPDLRSSKMVYDALHDVLNTSEPALKDAVFVAIVLKREMSFFV
jgi:hypothetical protein